MKQPMTIDQKLDGFRRRLLDLTRRNRLLNFRSKGNRSLHIVEEELGPVFERLLQDQKKRQFLSADEAGLVEESAPANPTSSDSVHDPTSPQPQDLLSEGPPTRRGASDLATRLSETVLDRRLLHLAREQQSAMQEQGCNILFLAFGMLRWTDSADSKKTNLAPLLLLPVELVRSGVSQRHRMRLLDDDVVVNPTLVELCARDFDLQIPEFEGESAESVDAFFGELEQIVRNVPGWELERELHLGLFSFAKLLMYLDLDPARWPDGSSIREHPLVQALAGLGAPAATDGMLEAHELDEKISPQESFQVLDADSSQQVAILGAKQGHSMVIEGPPGTGKSQTITNIIAECLAEGKTVLFVAVKAAALEVVKRRLDQVQLGDFVLEMHSRKANKRTVLDELNRVLNATYTTPQPSPFDARKLERTREILNKYSRTMHARIGSLGVTIYQAMGHCARLHSEPESPFGIKGLLQWDQARLDKAEQAVARLARAAERIGDPKTHLWRGVRQTDIKLQARQALKTQLTALRDASIIATETGGELAQRLGSSVALCRRGAKQLVDAVRAVLAGTELTATEVRHDAWNTLPDDVSTIISVGRDVVRMRAELADRWKSSAEDVDWSPIASRRRRKTSWILQLVSPAWHRDTRLIRQHLGEDVELDETQMATDLSNLDTVRESLTQLRSLDARGRELFGDRWQGEGSNWDQLESFAASVVAVRASIVAGIVSEESVAQVIEAKEARSLSGAAKQFVAAYRAISDATKEIEGILAIDWNTFLDGDKQTTLFEDWHSRVRQCLDEDPQLSALDSWMGYQSTKDECKNLTLKQVVDWCISDGWQHGTENWLGAFRRQFYRLWLDEVLAQMPDVQHIRGDELASLIHQFRFADKHWLETSRGRLVAEVAARRPQQASVAGASSRLGILQAEIRRRRKLKPIRQLLSLVGDVVQTIKPCFMMSPISVSQYLEPAKIDFDVVIFDEASQVEPADAIGAVARAKQLILVGDEKQLPPTSFFASIDASTEDDESDESIATDDLESVLAVGQVCLPRRTTLRWHYRSRHQSLIEFSNDQFYDNQLRVFPSPCLDRNELGLSLRYIPDGVYLRGKGQYNPKEAHAVAEAVIKHAREQSKQTLGVGAFSVAQQHAIEDEIETLRRTLNDPSLETFFEGNEEEPFFVKNLETIQGDERDVILLSIGYGPDQNRRILRNFGPLNREGGWRRLNVLITRSRRRCVVFSSMKSEDLQVDPSNPRAVRALRDYLHFAEFGALPTGIEYRQDHDSPFEQDVCLELRKHGWIVHAQVGCAGFWIDLAVVDPHKPGRYLLGIECDGATYHSSATARDRDRLRQEVLEGLGWKVHRIWSTDWFHHRSDTLQLLLDKLNLLNNGSGAADDTTARTVSDEQNRINVSDAGPMPLTKPEGEIGDDGAAKVKSPKRAHTGAGESVPGDRQSEVASPAEAAESECGVKRVSKSECVTVLCDELRAQGWPTQTIVRYHGVYFDLVVPDPGTKRRFLVGIVCEAFPNYAGDGRKEDSGGLPQEVRGCPVFRLNANNWNNDPKGVLDRLFTLLQEESAHLLHDDPAEKVVTQNGLDDASDGAPEGTIPYERFNGETRGDRKTLLAISVGNTVALVSEVVATEGPIHKDELFRVIAGLFSARVRGAVADQLDFALLTAVTRQVVRAQGDFVWPVNLDRPCVRWRGTEDAVSSSELICTEEIAEAARLVVEHEFGVPLDDLPAAAMRYMGFRRITTNLSELGQLGVEQAMQLGLIKADQHGFMVPCR